MKLYFGLYSRFIASYYEIGRSGMKKKYALEFDKDDYLNGKICATCVGCLGFNHKINRFLCLPFRTEVDIYSAESPQIPCSKYKKMRFKKL